MMIRTKLANHVSGTGVALLSMIFSAVSADATTIDFAYGGSIKQFTAPVTGTYTVDVLGAQGGVNTGAVVNGSGLGAQADGTFSLIAGQVLNIVVGGLGGNGSGLDGGGGGGGGSFVTLADVSAMGVPGAPAGCSEIRVTVCRDTLLVAAGGGGGAGTLFSGQPGETGNFGSTTSGASGNGISSAFGGGGFGGLDGGGGGGGYINNGISGDPNPNSCAGGNGCGGTSFLNGASGGSGTAFSLFGLLVSAGGNGGFGDGGGGGQGGAGGGGGGYSGGDGADQGGAGGGGGSYLNEARLSAATGYRAGGVRNGNGDVLISFDGIPISEPGGLMVLGAGLVGLGGLAELRRNRD